MNVVLVRMIFKSSCSGKRREQTGRKRCASELAGGFNLLDGGETKLSKGRNGERRGFARGEGGDVSLLPPEEREGGDDQPGKEGKLPGVKDDSCGKEHLKQMAAFPKQIQRGRRRKARTPPWASKTETKTESVVVATSSSLAQLRDNAPAGSGGGGERALM